MAERQTCQGKDSHEELRVSCEVCGVTLAVLRVGSCDQLSGCSGCAVQHHTAERAGAQAVSQRSSFAEVCLCAVRVHVFCRRYACNGVLLEICLLTDAVPRGRESSHTCLSEVVGAPAGCSCRALLLPLACVHPLQQVL